MNQYIGGQGFTHGTSMRSQAILKSFHAAVEQVTRTGYIRGVPYEVGRWQLEFRMRPGDVLPVINHGLYK